MAERYIDTIYAHDDGVRSVSYSPCGRLLLSGGGDGKTRTWDIKKTRLVHEHAAKSSVVCVGFSPDGKLLATMARDGEIKVFDRDDKLVIETKFAPNAGFAFSPDSRHLLGANGQGRVFLYSIQNKTPLYVHKHNTDQEVHAVAISPDGRYIASAGTDLVIRLYDMQDGKEKPYLEYHKNCVSSLAFSPDSKTLGSGDHGAGMAYWDVTKSGTGESLKNHFTWAGHQINAVAFSPDGLIFASTGNDSRLKLFDINNGNKRLEDLSGHQRYIHSLSFSPDGKFAATGSGDNTIRIWNIKKPNLVN